MKFSTLIYSAILFKLTIAMDNSDRRETAAAAGRWHGGTAGIANRMAEKTISDVERATARVEARANAAHEAAARAREAAEQRAKEEERLANAIAALQASQAPVAEAPAPILPARLVTYTVPQVSQPPAQAVANENIKKTEIAAAAALAASTKASAEASTAISLYNQAVSAKATQAALDQAFKKMNDAVTFANQMAANAVEAGKQAVDAKLDAFAKVVSCLFAM